METSCKYLSAGERNTIQRGLNDGLRCRQVAQHLGRCPSTVTREVARNRLSQTDDAAMTGRAAHARCRRGRRKLVDGSPLLQEVVTDLQAGLSPEQIASRYKRLHSTEPTRQVSHETIDRYIDAQLRGEWRKTLIAALRQSHKTRWPRTRGQDRRGRLRNMVSIHERPPEVLDRAVASSWEGDLIKGAGNASAVGTLAARKSRFVLLAKLDGTDATAVLEGFTRRMRTLPPSIRQRP